MKIKIALFILIIVGIFAWLDGFQAINSVSDNIKSGKTAATFRGMP